MKGIIMRKFLLIGAAAAALAVATPSMADDRGLVVGGTTGAWTGGTIGFFLGGPIGAAIGGWTGAAIGASVGDDVGDRRRGGDVDLDVDVGGSIQIGDFVGDDVRLRPIRGEDDYGYFRADGEIYIVDLDTGEVVDIRNG
jgi:hypothetical protein